MGLFSWLFPSPEQRVARARRFLEQGRPDEARLEVLELDHPDAAELLVTAETALCAQNLKAALEYGRAGDHDRVHIHLELAEQFHHGGLEDEIRNTRRELREIRQAQQAEEAEKKEEQAKKLLANPLGLEEQGWVAPEGDVTPQEADEAEARLALLLENYPEALRGTVRELGPDFVRAVLALEDGRADDALKALLALPDEAALVQWERGRAAHALGDAAAAARAVKGFAKRAGGHFPMGRVHSGTYLAQLLAEAGEVRDALTVLREVRREDPQQGGFLYAQLLLANGELERAERTTRELVRKNPKTMAVYALLARVRMAGEHRVEAMRALEAGFEATHCAPGKCGYQPPDLDAHRLLATLYLEEGLEQDRALELADIAAGLVQRPTVADVYLRALVAEARGEAGVRELAAQLVDQLDHADPRRERVLKLSA